MPVHPRGREALHLHSRNERDRREDDETTPVDLGASGRPRRRRPPGRRGGCGAVVADAVTTPLKGMTWIPGGAFAMGSDAFYPEERPVRRVEVEGFWIDRQPVTVGAVRALRRRDGIRDRGRAPARPRRLPRRRPGRARARARSCSTRPPGPVDLGDVRSWWRYVPGAFWRAARRARLERRGAPAPPGHPRRLRGRRRLRGLGGQGAADRGRVGARGPRRPGGRRSSRGATRSPRADVSWPTRGRASSRGRTCAPTATRARHRWRRSRPTATGSTT